MNQFLSKSLSGIRRGVVTFCAAVAMIVVYGVGTIVTQGFGSSGHYDCCTGFNGFKGERTPPPLSP